MKKFGNFRIFIVVDSCHWTLIDCLLHFLCNPWTTARVLALFMSQECPIYAKKHQAVMSLVISLPKIKPK